MAVRSPVEKALAYSILARGLRPFGSGQRAIWGGRGFESLSTNNYLCALSTGRGPGRDYVTGGQQTLESSQQYFYYVLSIFAYSANGAQLVWVSTNTSSSVSPSPTPLGEKLQPKRELSIENQNITLSK